MPCSTSHPSALPPLLSYSGPSGSPCTPAPAPPTCDSPPPQSSLGAAGPGGAPAGQGEGRPPVSPLRQAQRRPSHLPAWLCSSTAACTPSRAPAPPTGLQRPHMCCPHTSSPRPYPPAAAARRRCRGVGCHRRRQSRCWCPQSPGAGATSHAAKVLLLTAAALCGHFVRTALQLLCSAWCADAAKLLAHVLPGSAGLAPSSPVLASGLATRREA